MTFAKLYRRGILLALIAGSIVLIIFLQEGSSLLHPGDYLQDLAHLSSYEPHLQDALSQFSQTPAVKGPKLPLQAPQELKKGAEIAEKAPQLDPCTVVSAHHGFIDLRPLLAAGNEGRSRPWPAKGHDLGHNFTIGVCLLPFKKLTHSTSEIKDEVDISAVGAFYVDQALGQYVSMGEFSTGPKYRGKKLTLTYENGSYCDVVDAKTNERLRRLTLLTFTCDREMMAKAVVSYVGGWADCSYHFEVRSNHACPTAAKADNLAVVWIFVLIALAMVMVYFSGGVLYRYVKAKVPAVKKEVGV